MALNKLNNIPTGPDSLHGGDGLPDWMQFTVTILQFILFSGILWLLFHPTLELKEHHRDLLNIIIGTFIATFGKTIDFWFKHDKTKKNETS
jgi:hypothetical protein|tara:strand:+ start:96 stop:368 length:273 start_codon:yes stop_codon:yes gene_type:complete